MSDTRGEISTEDLCRITVYGNESVRITEHRPVHSDGKPDRTRAPKYDFSVPVIDPTGHTGVISGPITGATSLPEARKLLDGAVQARIAEIEAEQRRAIEERSRIIAPGVATGPRRIIQ
jgi:hypothetical protein